MPSCPLQGNFSCSKRIQDKTIKAWQRGETRCFKWGPNDQPPGWPPWTPLAFWSYHEVNSILYCNPVPWGQDTKFNSLQGHEKIRVRQATLTSHLKRHHRGPQPCPQQGHFAQRLKVEQYFARKTWERFQSSNYWFRESAFHFQSKRTDVLVCVCTRGVPAFISSHRAGNRPRWRPTECSVGCV